MPQAQICGPSDLRLMARAPVAQIHSEAAALTPVFRRNLNLQTSAHACHYGLPSASRSLGRANHAHRLHHRLITRSIALRCRQTQQNRQQCLKYRRSGADPTARRCGTTTTAASGAAPAATLKAAPGRDLRIGTTTGTEEEGADDAAAVEEEAEGAVEREEGGIGVAAASGMPGAGVR